MGAPCAFHDPAPAEALGLGLHPVPCGPGESRGEGGSLHLDSELTMAMGGEEVEGSPRGAALVHEVETHLCQGEGHLPLRLVAQHCHGNSGDPGLTPAKPEADDRIGEAIQTGLLPIHQIWLPPGRPVTHHIPHAISTKP